MFLQDSELLPSFWSCLSHLTIKVKHTGGQGRRGKKKNHFDAGHGIRTGRVRREIYLEALSIDYLSENRLLQTFKRSRDVNMHVNSKFVKA